MKQSPRCSIGMPLNLMAELRKIKDENHTTAIGAIALLINIYKRNKQNES